MLRDGYEFIWNASARDVESREREERARGSFRKVGTEELRRLRGGNLDERELRREGILDGLYLLRSQRVRDADEPSSSVGRSERISVFYPVDSRDGISRIVQEERRVVFPVQHLAVEIRVVDRPADVSSVEFH